MPLFTPLQGQYLAFIDSYERLYGRSPSERELERHFLVTPPSVHQMILTLDRKGLITRIPGAARSITLRVSATALPPLAPHPGRSRSTRHGAHSGRSDISLKQGERRVKRRAAPASRVRKPRPDPASEYIDSPLMTHRLRQAGHVSARIEGRYGVYRTCAQLTGSLQGDCTCPSDPQPCKHVRALRATWAAYPESFFDARAFLRSLGAHEKPQLIEMIGHVVAALPEALGVLGVPGFDGDQEYVDV